MSEDPVLLAIDPGSSRSAYVVLHNGAPIDFGILPNEEMLELVRRSNGSDGVAVVVIEKVESFGMPVGAEVFETVFWSGRFAEAASPKPVHRVGRKAVKRHVCGTDRAKDPNVRQALIDRYGGSRGKDAAVGRKASPGPLYGISKDIWAALALALTWSDSQV